MEQLPLQNNLKRIRIEKGLTQRQVTDLMGLTSQDRISRWENGRLVPHIKNLMKLSKIYEVSIESLYP